MLNFKRYKPHQILFVFGCCLLMLHCEQAPQPKAPVLLEQATVIVDTVPSKKVEKPFIKPDYDTLLWAEVALEKNDIQIDLRYATENNFVKEQLYDCPRCFLRPEAAEALYQVQSTLQTKGYSLKLFDCYRPKSIQERLWEKVPDATYVTPPKKGSMHNRGFAVDATLVDQDGNEVDMGTEFDFFGRRAHHDNRDLDSTILMHRDLLKSTMAQFGFKHIRTEWWHYGYKGPYSSPFKVADYLWECGEVH